MQQQFFVPPVGYAYYQAQPNPNPNQQSQQNAAFYAQGQHNIAAQHNQAQVLYQHQPSVTQPSVRNKNGHLQLEPTADILACGSNTTGYFDTGGRIGGLCGLLTKVHRDVHEKFGCCLWHVHEGLHQLAIQKNVDFKLTSCTSPERQGEAGELFRWQPRSCSAEDWLLKALRGKGGSVVVHVNPSPHGPQSSRSSTESITARACTGQCAVAQKALTDLEEAKGQVKQLSQQLVQVKLQARTLEKELQQTKLESEKRALDAASSKQAAAATQAESFLKQIDGMKQQLNESQAAAEKKAAEHAIQARTWNEHRCENRGREAEEQELQEKLREIGKDCVKAEKEAETAIAAARATCAKASLALGAPSNLDSDLPECRGTPKSNARNRLSVQSTPGMRFLVFEFALRVVTDLVTAASNLNKHQHQHQHLHQLQQQNHHEDQRGVSEALAASSAQALALATQAAEAAERACSILLGASLKVPRPRSSSSSSASVAAPPSLPASSHGGSYRDSLPASASPAASPRPLSQGISRPSTSPTSASMSPTHNQAPPTQMQTWTALSNSHNLNGPGPQGQPQAAGFSHSQAGHAQPAWDQRGMAAQGQGQGQSQSQTVQGQSNGNSIYHPSAARRVLDRVGTVVGSRHGASSSEDERGVGRR